MLSPLLNVTNQINYMSAEIKTTKAGGVKIESIISKATHKKLKRYADKNATSVAQLVRNFVQGLVK